MLNSYFLHFFYKEYIRFTTNTPYIDTCLPIKSSYLVFSSKTICDEAFFTALLYVFVIFLHTFLVETSDYLQINRQVKGLPVKRIYGIAGGMLGFFMILIFFLCIPSVLMISMRQYADIRTWADGKVLMIGGMDTEISQETFPMVNEQLDMLIDEQTESKELPVWIPDGM